ncbi:hypothetical protein CWI66_17140 [Halomonas sp. 141]|nr:hypothetical protein CWI66_17140 [Halomonas sp. 141]
MIVAISPRHAASYPLPVRQASVLPSTSFRFHLTVDTLAVRLALPLAGCAGDFHPQVIPKHHPREQRRHGATRHAWRTTKKPTKLWSAYIYLLIIMSKESG